MKSTFVICITLAALNATPLLAQDVNFGSDESQWANDGECDDRRFAGPGMAAELLIKDIGKDASDCQSLVAAGSLVLWDATAAVKATQCSAISFGDDSSDYANDGECDDPRFEGIGQAANLALGDLMKDATDCSALCEFGAIALRDY